MRCVDFLEHLVVGFGLKGGQESVGGTRFNWKSRKRKRGERGGSTLLDSRLDLEPCLCPRTGLLWGSRSSQPHSVGVGDWLK